jgi:hypothetical protein
LFNTFIFYVFGRSKKCTSFYTLFFIHHFVLIKPLFLNFLFNFQDLLRKLQIMEDERNQFQEQTLAFQDELDKKIEAQATMQEEVKIFQF